MYCGFEHRFLCVDNKIGDDGAKDLAEALRSNDTLITLFLGGKKTDISSILI